MNKIGAAKKTSAVVWVSLFVGIIFVGLMVYALFGRPTAQTALTGPQVTTTTTGAGVTPTIVTSNPLWSVSGMNRQQSGTSVANSIQASTNGGGYVTVTAGTTTAVPGQIIEALFTNDTQYHNAYLGNSVLNDANVKQGGPFTITPGTFPITVYFNKNTSVTENIYSTTGVVMSNNATAAASVNQSDLGNGASYNLKDEMTATSLTSTQDMICVIEIEAGTNASTTPSGATLSLDGVNIPVKDTAKPTWYSTLGTSSNVYLFEVPPLDTSATKTFYIGLNAKSTGRFSPGTRIIKDCYTKEYFLDTNTGKVAYDVADTDGTLQSMAHYKYQFVFI